MNFCSRYYFQVCLPVFAVFLIADDIARISRLAAVTAVILLLSATPSELRYGLVYFPGLLRAHVDLGKRLAPFTKDHTLLAGDVGVIPYYSQWTSFDFAGLATNSIAQHPLTAAGLEARTPRSTTRCSPPCGPTPRSRRRPSSPCAACCCRSMSLGRNRTPRGWRGSAG